MYVDEIFSGLDYANFPKITVIENKMGVREMVRVKDITVTSTCEHHEVTMMTNSCRLHPLVVKSLVCLKINRIVRFFLACKFRTYDSADPCRFANLAWKQKMLL